MDNFLQKLNLDERFDSFKILSVDYDKENNSCQIYVLYPERVSLSEDDRNIIIEKIKLFLNLNANLEIKFKKSILDTDLISIKVNEFFKIYASSVYSQIDDSAILIEKIDSINNKVSLFLTKDFCEYYERNNLQYSLNEYLQKFFCGEFIFSVTMVDSKPISDILERRLEKVSAEKSPSQMRRYEVSFPIKIVGSNITPKPEYIKDNTKEKELVILAGEISKWTKKPYTNKKTGQERHLYSFLLKDFSGEINCAYFCSKTNEKKMDCVIDGSQMLMVGNLKNNYNNKLTYYPKSLSYCTLMPFTENVDVVKEEVSVIHDGYQYTFPEKYVETAQAGLFDIEPSYSSDITEKKYVVFDTETTGLDADLCEIIEIGAVKIEKGKIIEKFSCLMKPHSEISSLITSINGITNEMVESCRYNDELVMDFYNFCKDCVLVGYNVSFDIKFLKNLLLKIGIELCNESYDVLELAKTKLKLSNYKLISVVNHLNLSLENAHRAYNDALATAKVFLKLNEK